MSFNLYKSYYLPGILNHLHENQNTCNAFTKVYMFETSSAIINTYKNYFQNLNNVMYLTLFSYYDFYRSLSYWHKS